MSDETLWLEHHIGGDDIGNGDIRAGLNVHHISGEPGNLLMWHGKPDWCRDPETGKKVRCVDVFEAAGVNCPSCKVHHDETVTFIVCEASAHPGHLWMALQCPACRQYACKLVKET